MRIVVDTPDGQITRDLSGRLISGTADVGDVIVVSPINSKARITGIETLADGIQLQLDREVEIGQQTLVSHSHSMPVETDVFLVDFEEAPSAQLIAGQSLRAEFAIGTFSVTLQSQTTDEKTGAPAQAVFRASELLALDPYEQNSVTGAIRLLIDGVEIAHGRISMEGYADQRSLVTTRATNITRVGHRITEEHRVKRYGHKGAVIWLTGLSGSGKSTLAVELEKKLFERNFQVYVLDGDNVRHGLNANLGFSPEDRSENIRRVGEVAALFARAGLIAISAFISPYRSDRERARAATDDGFHEIHVNADLSVCENRDPKGLYKKARAGEILDFTGISAPYEAPENADLVVETGSRSVSESVESLLSYVIEQTAIKQD